MQSLKGHLLIATPQLNSTIFARSVILMLEATEQAAAGVILNQPIKTTLTELSGKIFAEDFEWDKPISLGGPLASSLMVLHSEEHLADKEVIPESTAQSNPPRSTSSLSSGQSHRSSWPIIRRGGLASSTAS